MVFLLTLGSIPLQEHQIYVVTFLFFEIVGLCWWGAENVSLFQMEIVKLNADQHLLRILHV